MLKGFIQLGSALRRFDKLSDLRLRGLMAFEDFLEGLFPTVTVEEGGVSGGLEGEEQPDRQEHKGREPHAEEHVEVTEDGHALGNG